MTKVRVKSLLHWCQSIRDLLVRTGFRLLIFPCNQFAGQMPEADGDEISYNLRAHNAPFTDVFAKVKSKTWNARTIAHPKCVYKHFFPQINVNGDSAIPLYKYLKEKQTGTFGSAIKWNFTKFLIDKSGQPVSFRNPHYIFEKTLWRDYTTKI